MNTNKTNTKGGAKEVTTTKNTIQKNTAITANGKTTPPKAEEKSQDPKQTKVADLPKQEKSLEEQISYFLGMEKLVKIVRRLETHLDAVNDLTVKDSEVEQFENESITGAHIELYDSNHQRYTIKNPRLVKEMLEHLQKQIEGKINEYNDKILTYDPTHKAGA